MKCKNCGMDLKYTINTGGKYCPNCGSFILDNEDFIEESLFKTRTDTLAPNGKDTCAKIGFKLSIISLIFFWTGLSLDLAVIGLILSLIGRHGNVSKDIARKGIILSIIGIVIGITFVIISFSYYAESILEYLEMYGYYY